MKKLTLIAAAVGLMAIGRSAQAQLIVGSTGPLVNSGETLDISYQVYEYTPGVYTYDYQLVASADLASFSIAVDPAADASFAIVSAGVFSGPPTGIDGDTILFTWNYFEGPTSTESVSFTDDLAPGYDTWGANDSGAGWGNPPEVPTPDPVPEASTVMAGALMLLPLGIGAIRAVRRDRTA